MQQRLLKLQVFYDGDGHNLCREFIHTSLAKTVTALRYKDRFLIRRYRATHTYSVSVFGAIQYKNIIPNKYVLVFTGDTLLRSILHG
jgi:hypothetical protein